MLREINEGNELEACSSCRFYSYCFGIIETAGLRISESLDQESPITFGNDLEPLETGCVPLVRIHLNSAITPLYEDFNCQHPLDKVTGMVADVAIRQLAGQSSGH